MTQDTLEELGLDIDYIQEQVISRATEKVVSQTKWNIKSEISETAKLHIQNEIEEIIEEALTSFYQPVDCFGEPKRNVQKISIKEYFKKQANEWWTTKVSKRNGQTYGDHPYITRAEYIALKVIKDSFENELQLELKKFVLEAKEQAITELHKYLRGAINSIWNVKLTAKEDK